MWTLVIIAIALPSTQSGGANVSVVVPGFSTEQACINAANKIQIPSLQSGHTTALPVVKECVSQHV